MAFSALRLLLPGKPSHISKERAAFQYALVTSSARGHIFSWQRLQGRCTLHQNLLWLGWMSRRNHSSTLCETSCHETSFASFDFSVCPSFQFVKQGESWSPLCSTWNFPSTEGRPDAIRLDFSFVRPIIDNAASSIFSTRLMRKYWSFSLQNS